MDGFTADVNLQFNDGIFQGILEHIVDDSTMYAVHNLFAKMCDPYVPYLYGPLSQTLEIIPSYVRYVQPYANYQYIGIAPSGAPFNYTKSTHPQASSEWDKAMMQEHGDEFKEQVKQILIRRAAELYG